MGSERAGREITITAGRRESLLKSVGLSSASTLVIYTADAVPVLDTATDTDVPMVAEVQFGAGRATVNVEVDVARGCVLTVPAGEISVAVVYERDPQAPAAVEPDQRVGVTVSDGVHPGSARPTRTKRAHDVAHASTVVVKVPPRAVDVAILTSVLGVYGANLRAYFYRAPAGRMLVSAQVTGPEPLTLPNGIRAVAVENRTGVPLSLTLVFGLAL